MRRLLKASVVAIAVLMLAGCAGLELDRAKQVTPEGSAFQKELYGGYLTLASSEYAEADYADSDFFALRAAASGTKAAPKPQPIFERQLPEDKLGELQQARAQLVGALSKGAAKKFPALAANAQVQFECWLQEQEENFQPRDIAACRAAALEALSTLDTVLVPPAALAERPTEPKPLPQPVTFVVYFDFDSAGLNEAARLKLGEVVAAARERGSTQVLLSGHTDRTGANAYNAKLSELRAVAIADALASEGIPKVVSNVEAFGEFQPAVATEDDVHEPMNRRVEIIVR